MLLSSKDAANIIIHIILLATFITILFFTYGVYLEKKIVSDQLDYIVNGSVRDIKRTFPEVIPVATLATSRLAAPDMEKEDKPINDSNNKLKMKAALAVGLMILVGGGIVGGIYYKYPFNIKEMVVTNAISFSLVAILYMIYLTFIVADYKSADPNLVKKTIAQALLRKSPDSDVFNRVQYGISGMRDRLAGGLDDVQSRLGGSLDDIQSRLGGLQDKIINNNLSTPYAPYSHNADANLEGRLHGIEPPFLE